jgi:hypothetical protein
VVEAAKPQGAASGESPASEPATGEKPGEDNNKS